jgi:hypothetical protein
VRLQLNGLPPDGGASIQRAHNFCLKQTNVLEGSTVVVEHNDNDQAAGLEIAESFNLCGHQAYKTHIKSIAAFVRY